MSLREALQKLVRLLEGLVVEIGCRREVHLSHECDVGLNCECVWVIRI